MKHRIIIPYFCEEEMRRYRWIASHLAAMGMPEEKVEFLLAPAAGADPSNRLPESFGRLGGVSVYRCQTREKGYPKRVNAMFWEIMRHLNRERGGENGFALWLESDMIPVRKDWLERLEADWQSAPGRLVMGLYVPERRLPAPPSKAHINGGACYAMDFAGRVPEIYSNEPFDLAIFSSVSDGTRHIRSKVFAFSTLESLESDWTDPQKTILHGYLQPKDEFIQRGLARAGSPDLILKRPRRKRRERFGAGLRAGRCCRYQSWWYRNICPIHSPERFGEDNRNLLFRSALFAVNGFGYFGALCKSAAGKIIRSRKTPAGGLRD